MGGMEAKRPVVGPPLSHVLEEELGDEIVLYDSENEQLVSLNESAADIWRLCTGEFTVEDIVQRIAVFYGVDVDEVREPVEEAIEALAVNGLISPVSKTANDTSV
jgi:Coenzyme PQQ synthesis protein D (PqqD)